MEPKERAENLILGMTALLKGHEFLQATIDWLASEIEKSNAEALALERVACALVAEETPVNLPPGYSGEEARWLTRRNIAEAIRARGKM